MKNYELRGNMEENKNTTTAEQTTTEAPNKTYSQEEFEKALQSETDRRVTQALQKKEREMSKKLTEAEKLAKMSEEDKYKYQLEQKEQELAAKEREFTLRDNKIAAMKVLSEKELPADLVDFVIHEDAEVMMENIKKLDKYIKNVVASQIKSKIGGSTPKIGSVKETTREEFAKMSYSQKMELYRNDRELYNKLTGK